MSLPELGQYQQKLEAARTEGDLNNYLCRLSVELEIIEREAIMKSNLREYAKQDFIAKYGEEAYAEIQNQLV